MRDRHVMAFESYLPDYLPLVHPSPLNFRWQARNPWFAEDLLPVLRARVAADRYIRQMDHYDGLIRRLHVPEDFEPPTHLAYADIRAHAITRADLDQDVAGINASLELIPRTRGGGWPTEPVTRDGNYVDLVWHECEWRDGKSYTFVVTLDDGSYLGCAYLYPVGSRTPMTATMRDHDVDVSWWVTPDAYAAGHYTTLYEALQRWVREDFPFVNPHYSNVGIPI